MISWHTPLFDRLVQHAASQPLSLHVPGHQYGQAVQSLPSQVRASFGDMMRLDATELSVTDDLHHPEGAIQEAQQLAAQLYGAEETYFLIGGSTSGNLALLLSQCTRDTILITQRNVHKSILNGIMLSGAQAVFISPQLDSASGLATVPALADLEQALSRYPQAVAVMLSSPNYYGLGADLRAYAELVHRYAIPLLIDEAHGAHYGLHPELPGGALQAGADAVVQSTHKTLPALTMGAMLHIQGPRIDRGRLRQTLAAIQSSSPSYPIMASLDIARAACMYQGAALFDGALATARYLRQAIGKQLPWVGLLGSASEAPPIGEEDAAQFAVSGGELTKSLPERRGSEAIVTVDPLRLSVYDRTGSLSGYDWLKQLEREGIWAEMADVRYCVMLIGLSVATGDADRILAALHMISERCGLERQWLAAVHGRAANAAGQAAKTSELSAIRQELTDDGMAAIWSSSPTRISEPIRLSWLTTEAAAMEQVKLEEASGKTCAEMITPYPPGIPILYPGERLTAAILRAIGSLSERGAKFQGAADRSMASIKVYRS